MTLHTILLTSFVTNWFYVSEFPREAKSILFNTSWLFISMVLIMEQLIATGFNTFIAKYMQVSFGFVPSTANIITGTTFVNNIKDLKYCKYMVYAGCSR